MRLQTKAQDHRAAHTPSRTDAQALLGRRRQRPAGRQPAAMPRAPRRAGGPDRSRLRRGPGQRSGQAERSAPLIPLTLRGMHRSRRLRRSSARPSFALLSVLALLALACFPVFAHADSAGSVYEPEIPHAGNEGKTPTVKHETTNNNNSQAESSNTGGAGPSESGGSGPTSGSESSSGGSSKDNPSTGKDGGTGQGNSGNGPTAQQSGGSLSPNKAVSAPTEGTTSGSSSSPLIPILIAIAALAAISIGAVMVRQRRQRRAGGGQISPKAS